MEKGMERIEKDLQDPVLAAYHEQFGRELRDQNALFERLSLQIYAAGLQWETIVKKMPAYRGLFYDYDVAKVAGMSPDELADQVDHYPDVIKNHAKLTATITNATVIKRLSAGETSFIDYLTSLLPEGLPVAGPRTELADLAVTISKQMKKDGFSFTGPSTVQVFLDSIELFKPQRQAD
ncbi:DNA-3-methyladenine glycosylase I [Weissella cibaria]|uniref:DNA-3-methyladenine glycosylase I n=1 Tax=Weissella cibaria TaxID=137591 RepID=A0A2S1KTH3_9LACO|nr:DNA-3-methyladenine glycosylase I [Weissella cibaria]AWF96318.1 hypothetical protein B6254_1956 [Weissella cibaria]